jgi:hypothetical protein
MSSRQPRMRQAKSKALKEIDRILVENSINDEEYYDAIKKRSVTPPLSIEAPKITLKECKSMYENGGIKALLPFEVTKYSMMWNIYDFLIMLERIHGNENLLGRYYSEFNAEQEEKARLFYIRFDKRALSFIYGIIDDVSSYIEEL